MILKLVIDIIRLVALIVVKLLIWDGQILVLSISDPCVLTDPHRSAMTQAGDVGAKGVVPQLKKRLHEQVGMCTSSQVETPAIMVTSVSRHSVSENLAASPLHVETAAIGRRSVVSDQIVRHRVNRVRIRVELGPLHIGPAANRGTVLADCVARQMIL